VKEERPLLLSVPNDENVFSAAKVLATGIPSVLFDPVFNSSKVLASGTALPLA
jgi:hypothetical protein